VSYSETPARDKFDLSGRQAKTRYVLTMLSVPLLSKFILSEIEGVEPSRSVFDTEPAIDYLFFFHLGGGIALTPREFLPCLRR
jgi:hypothetical protein